MKGLTDRQRQVAILVARGLTDRQVGAELGLAPDTVRFHLDAVRRKLGLKGRREVAGALVGEGLATAEEIIGVTT